MNHSPVQSGYGIGHEPWRIASIRGLRHSR
jgi:hypothetical protein